MTEDEELAADIDFLDRLCADCGKDFGTHRASDNLCSGPGPMDWEHSSGTHFKDANASS
jgi:hypothetical protein